MTREQFISHIESTQAAFRRFLVALCCGDSDLADDMAQEAYLKAFMACDTLRDMSKFKSWIFRIGYTCFINHKRSARFFSEYSEAACETAQETADQGFRYQELYAALNALPVKERMSVLLFYMEGYSIKEIAEIESVSQEAVKQHLLRGRRHLRHLLSNS